MRFAYYYLFVILILTTVLTATACRSETFNVISNSESTAESQDESLKEGTATDTEHPERRHLTIGVFNANLNNVRDIVSLFNTRTPIHNVYVEIIDYLDIAQGDWNAAWNRLATEIVAGRAPDVLHLEELPYQQYIARGLLVDLNPLIDSDPELSRDDLMENVLRALEADGHLYQIPLTFRISTIVGNEQMLGRHPGWTMSELLAVLDDNPQADMPFGPTFHSGEFMWWFLRPLLGEFVDYETGNASFDRGDFSELLEFAYRYISDDCWDADFLLQREMLDTGRQIMDALPVDSFPIMQRLNAKFGDEIVFKGIPESDRNGNRFLVIGGYAITTNANDKDAAWTFIRTILMEDIQNQFTSFTFPINRTVFEREMERAMSTPLFNERGEVLSQEAADRLMQVIDSITHTVSIGTGDSLQNIVFESVNDYFNGSITSEEAARIIQSRASIYLAEQMLG